MKVVNIEIDSREQKPLLFPSTIQVQGKSSTSTRRLQVRKFTKKLDVGDYRLKCRNSKAIIERKGSAHEIIKNLFDKKDMRRQGRSFKKLADATDYPYLLLAFNPGDIERACKRRLVPSAPKSADIVIERLMSVVNRYGLKIIWMTSTKSKSARRTIGSVVIQILLSHQKGDS